MSDRLPLSVRETLRAARITASVPVLHGISLDMVDEAERWITAEASIPLTDTSIDWLRQYFIDTYNEDWATKYQLELVGEIPTDVLEWCDIEQIPPPGLRVVR